MRDHDSGKTLTLNADDMDRVMAGLLSSDRDALLLADELNKRWRAAPPAAPEPATLPADLLALSEAATPGPWTYSDDVDPWSVRAPSPDKWTPKVADAGNPADAALIAAAVNFVRDALSAPVGGRSQDEQERQL